jgi:uncharacterized membrane protein HdeD (DUF308 family)
MRDMIPTLGLVFIVVGALNAVANLGMLAVGLVMLVLTAVEQIHGYEPLYVDLLESLDELGPLFLANLLFVLWSVLSVGFLVSGLKLRQYKGRTLSIAMCVVGLVPCLASHPMCTYILLVAASIFGLVVLTNPVAAAAFEEEPL